MDSIKAVIRLTELTIREGEIYYSFIQPWSRWVLSYCRSIWIPCEVVLAPTRTYWQSPVGSYVQWRQFKYKNGYFISEIIRDDHMITHIKANIDKIVHIRMGVS